MAIDESAATAIIYKYAKAPVETFADNLYEKQKESAASVCHTEEERNAVMEAENVKYMLLLNGTSMSIEETTEEEPHIISLIDEGKPTPVTKGPNGVRTEIDGSTGESHSFSQGYPITDYAWSATHFRRDTHEILKTTSSDIISGVVPEAYSEIASEVVRPAILEQIHQGGGS